MIRIRWMGLAAFVAFTVAFALSTVLLVAGSTSKLGQGHFWLAVNTSKTGQDLIQISTATEAEGVFGDLLDLPIVGGIAGDITDGINSALDDTVQDLQGQIVGNLTDRLGLKDVYRFFLSGICEGLFEDDDDDENSAARIEACYPYSAGNRGLRNISASIPSSLVLGGTNITVPLVAVLGSTIGSIVNLSGTASRFMFSLVLVGAITSGLLAFASLAFVALRFPHLAVAAAALLSILGVASLGLVAAAGTGIVYGSAASAGGLLGDGGLGTEVVPGRDFVIMAWLAAGFSAGGAAYWLSVWFVEYRTSSYRRRRRTDDEVGNWRGILQEVVGDLLGDRKSPAVDKTLPK